MSQRNMNLNKAIVPIMLGLTLSGVSAALVYLIFRKSYRANYGGAKICTRRNHFTKVIYTTNIPEKHSSRAIPESSLRNLLENIPEFSLNDEDLDEKYLAIKTSRPALIEVHIPKDCVGVIIGRGGSNIKSIQDQTNTKIYFKDELETDEFRVCAIRGTADSAQVAEFMIRDLILNQPLIETVEIKIPQSSLSHLGVLWGNQLQELTRYYWNLAGKEETGA
uniref:(California timema) hypothetical protein n=1 Tax=Timema californicum TaxID=61474 RepID=A0A7R9P8H0_TIMCA|nr:unnamed protein product [Timema californicum]